MSDAGLAQVVLQLRTGVMRRSARRVRFHGEVWGLRIGPGGKPGARQDDAPEAGQLANGTVSSLFPLARTVVGRRLDDTRVVCRKEQEERVRAWQSMRL